MEYNMHLEHELQQRGFTQAEIDKIVNIAKDQFTAPIKTRKKPIPILDFCQEKIDQNDTTATRLLLIVSAISQIRPDIWELSKRTFGEELKEMQLPHEEFLKVIPSVVSWSISNRKNILTEMLSTAYLDVETGETSIFDHIESTLNETTVSSEVDSETTVSSEVDSIESFTTEDKPSFIEESVEKVSDQEVENVSDQEVENVSDQEVENVSDQEVEESSKGRKTGKSTKVKS